MITKSVWGPPPRQFGDMMTRFGIGKPSTHDACVVGASDGRFVLPLVRRGVPVVCYDIDPISLYGGQKTVPLSPRRLRRLEYVPVDARQHLPDVPSHEIEIPGLAGRLRAEGTAELAEIRCVDFFRFPPQAVFDFVFTSCSMQYKMNRDLEINRMVHSLQEIVRPMGILVIEYMMPLQDSHTWKASQFLRSGAMLPLFPSQVWEVLIFREPRVPVFEAAHVDRPADHFHRIGRIAVRRSE
jgi:hypothetical protein